MELTPKNLYDYLSKHNANQRKTEKLLEVFGVELADLHNMLEGGMLLGIFTYDKEDGWNTESFSNIDSKKFFDFVYAGKVPTSSSPAKKTSKSTPEATSKPIKSDKAEAKEDTDIKKEEVAKPEKKPEPKLPIAKKEAPKAIAKPTLKPIQAQEPVEPKPFVLRGLYKLILRNNEEGTDMKTMMKHYVIDENDLAFVLAYLESKKIFTKDTQMRWYADADMANDPLLKKTLIGLRNLAILNKEFKNKAMRGTK